MLYRRSKKARLASLIAATERLEMELEAERAISTQLQAALRLAMDPNQTVTERIDELIERASTDMDATVVQAPDGEFIAPQAFDWERLAHDIYDSETETGGAGGTWGE